MKIGIWIDDLTHAVKFRVLGVIYISFPWIIYGFTMQVTWPLHRLKSILFRHIFCSDQ